MDIQELLVLSMVLISGFAIVRNYKKFHSIVLLAIALPDKRFTYPEAAMTATSFKDRYCTTRCQSGGVSGSFDSNFYHLIGGSDFALKS